MPRPEVPLFRKIVPNVPAWTVDNGKLIYDESSGKPVYPALLSGISKFSVVPDNSVTVYGESGTTLAVNVSKSFDTSLSVAGDSRFYYGTGPENLNIGLDYGTFNMGFAKMYCHDKVLLEDYGSFNIKGGREIYESTVSYPRQVAYFNGATIIVKYDFRCGFGFVWDNNLRNSYWAGFQASPFEGSYFNNISNYRIWDASENSYVYNNNYIENPFVEILVKLTGYVTEYGTGRYYYYESYVSIAQSDKLYVEGDMSWPFDNAHRIGQTNQTLYVNMQGREIPLNDTTVEIKAVYA